VDRLRYAHANGFTIGSHTWSHADITTLSSWELDQELDELENALWKILGVKPALFRPPYGSYNQDTIDNLNERGYTVVGWGRKPDADLGDAIGKSVLESNNVVDSLLNTDKVDGTLFLGHDTHWTTAHEVLPYALSKLSEKGVHVVTADRCLGVQPYQAIGAPSERDESWTCS
jgi:peptidoglycan/xylan/chitin deacetylase (PgdA/CDA1 family)